MSAVHGYTKCERIQLEYFGYPARPDKAASSFTCQRFRESRRNSKNFRDLSGEFYPGSWRNRLLHNILVKIKSLNSIIAGKLMPSVNSRCTVKQLNMWHKSKVIRKVWMKKRKNILWIRIKIRKVKMTSKLENKSDKSSPDGGYGWIILIAYGAANVSCFVALSTLISEGWDLIETFSSARLIRKSIITSVGVD